MAEAGERASFNLNGVSEWMVERGGWRGTGEEPAGGDGVRRTRISRDLRRGHAVSSRMAEGAMSTGGTDIASFCNGTRSANTIVTIWKPDGAVLIYAFTM